MTIKAKCKFCGRPMEAEMEDSYAQLGDPYKLVQLLACNLCSDLRVERRKLEKGIGTICNVLTLVSPASKDREKARPALEKLTKSYTFMIARWYKTKVPVWDGAIVDALIGHPEMWGETLHGCWKSFRQTNQPQLI